jgi:hypothetical protein
MGNINIFGVKFAYPRGLRKSPGTNAYAGCVASKMSGHKGGGRQGVRNAFREAAKACKGTRG